MTIPSEAMSRFVPYEIGANYRPGGIVLIGRDPGADEVREGRPFVGIAGRLLDDVLREAGIRRQDVALLNTVRFKPEANQFWRHPRTLVKSEIVHLHWTLADLRPNVVVALGNEAAFAAIGSADWPARDGSVFTAGGIEQRRGYLFEGIHGLKVLATVHPAAVVRVWTPWRVLLSYDLQRAKEESAYADIRRPVRQVEVVSSARDAELAAQELSRARRVSVDIENYDERNLACVGFAGRSDRAYVFPAAFLDECRGLLESEKVAKVFQNGQYDLYFLLTRCGIRVGGFRDDSLIAWHSCYPELAGAGEAASGKRKTKTTRKSLAFLASLFTTDAWWKDYEFSDDEERFVLNGRDCCITLDCMEVLDREIDRLGTRGIYEHEVSLVWPVVVMQQRGMRVDDVLRRDRIQKLEQRIVEQRAEINELVMPLLTEHRQELEAAGTLRLFHNIEGVCRCCRHAEKKQKACWSCAGFEKAPSKKDLVAAGGDPSATKEELEAALLPVCRVCGGAPRREWLEYNPGSPEQSKVVLYDLLKLPKKWKTVERKGKKEQVLTCDEEAVKSLLAGVGE